MVCVWGPGGGIVLSLFLPCKLRLTDLFIYSLTPLTHSFIHYFIFFWDRVSLSSPGWPPSQISSLSLLRARITSMCDHAWPSLQLHLCQAFAVRRCLLCVCYYNLDFILSHFLPCLVPFTFYLVICNFVIFSVGTKNVNFHSQIDMSVDKNKSTSCSKSFYEGLNGKYFRFCEKSILGSS